MSPPYQGDTHQVQQCHEQASDGEFYLPIAADLHVAKPWSCEKCINEFKWTEMPKTLILGDVQLPDQILLSLPQESLPLVRLRP